MNIKLIPDEPRFIHNGDTTVAINNYVLMVEQRPVDIFEVSAKTTRRGNDTMDNKLGEMIAQSKVHVKALRRAKRYLQHATEDFADMLQSITEKFEQLEVAECKEHDHLDDLVEGRIQKPNK
jgi:Mg2+ and Co2+ transporter CorA